MEIEETISKMTKARSEEPKKEPGVSSQQMYCYPTEVTTNFMEGMRREAKAHREEMMHQTSSSHNCSNQVNKAAPKETANAGAEGSAIGSPEAVGTDHAMVPRATVTDDRNVNSVVDQPCREIHV